MKPALRTLVLLCVGSIAGYAFGADDPIAKYLPLNAAPVHHRVVAENDLVRVLDVRIPPGDTVPAHQHDLPSVFITISPADLVFRNLAGETVRNAYRDRELPSEPHIELRGPAPAPRVVSNIDTVELRALRIELKQPAA